MKDRPPHDWVVEHGGALIIAGGVVGGILGAIIGILGNLYL